jgi:hypothetical protein
MSAVDGKLRILSAFFGRLVDRRVVDERHLRDDGGAACSDQAGLVGGYCIDCLEQNGQGNLSALIAGNGGCRRKAVLVGSGDPAKHGAERIVGAGLERHRLAGITRIELELQQIAKCWRHRQRGHVWCSFKWSGASRRGAFLGTPHDRAVACDRRGWGRRNDACCLAARGKRIEHGAAELSC